MKFYISTSPERIRPATVVYMRRTGDYGPGNHALMEAFKEWVRENGLYGEGTAIYGIPLDDPEKTAPGRRRYDVCAFWPQNQKPSSNQVKCRELEGGKYLTFLIPHTAAAVGAAWEMCFSELERLGYGLDETRPVMERYQKSLVERHFCELCVPVL